MTDLWGDRSGLARARERFLTGEPAVGHLRVPILNSWQRCQALGLMPDLFELPYQQDAGLGTRLLRAAQPVLDQLESQVAGTRLGVILADGQGLVLQCRVGEKALYKHFDAIQLAPGFTYAEQFAGTNGIGTTLEERRAFHVFGAEHFVKRLQPFVSVGAPIRDPLSGRVEGVVGLACWRPDAHQVMAAMAHGAAVAVERRLLEQRTDQERALFEAFLQVEGREQAPIMTLEENLVGSEDSGLTVNDQLVLQEKAADLISAARPAAVQVLLSRGQAATLVCRPMTSPSGEVGVVVKAILPGGAPRRQHVLATAPAPPPGDVAPDPARTAATPASEAPASDDREREPGEAPPQMASAPEEWLLSVGEQGVGRLAVAARERLRLLYDASLRIGATLDVTHTAEELAEVAVPRFADFITVDLLEPVLRGEEPAMPGPAMRRTAVGARHSDPPFQAVGERVSFASSAPQARCFASGRSVLEPDLSAVPEWLAQDPLRVKQLLEYGIHSLVTVALRTRGTVLGLVTFYRSGQSRPFEEDDLSLAEELVARVAMCIDNARRFTREHTIALTLQRSLLPRVLPEQTAVEAAHRYLPAQVGVGGVGGVGGDWFDIIPLSGTRVALVVGDVVGHGLHAAVTMGRLRTAVHNFAALDLSPDELLGRLDDLVIRLDQDEAAGPGGDENIGATCLYAVYDPVSQRCTLARAGHPLPAWVHPDGTVQFPDLPAGPPLGLGGLPFESVELELPEGSQLVLYTDGLVEDRDRDIDVGLEQLRRALSHPDRPPEQTCEAVLHALPAPHPSDDVTLLVARTRALDAQHTACWDVPADPAAVSGIRAAATRKLAEWGLEESAFTTELVLSELLSNAIRHASGPIQVRLLRDRTLICEVSDGSSTSPHLRSASATDEDGRGLFLIAQLAQRWGTRYTAGGKVIWAEQPLCPAASPACA